VHTATLLPDGRVLVAGSFSNSAELYDPRSGSWTAGGSVAGVYGGHTATLLADGTVLVAGGYDSTGALASAELYDPSTGSWTATGNMQERRTGHAATLLPNGRVLVEGGCNSCASSGNNDPLASAELYDPGSGK
jgi:N-acetylneuraminic acid mutarotase